MISTTTSDIFRYAVDLMSPVPLVSMQKQQESLPLMLQVWCSLSH